MKTQVKTQKLVLGGFIALIVISSFMLMPVIADSHDDDEDDDGVDDSYEEENSREVEIEYSPNEVEIESSLETGENIENKFEIKMKTSPEGLEMELEYEEEMDDNETEIEFEVKITEIVEFIDLNADGMYDSSDDDKVQVYKIDDFNPIEYTVEVIDNETVHVLFVETVDEIFSATLYATGEFADINGVVVAPTQVKVDIGIHNFSYIEDDSMLALKVKLESEIEVDFEEDDVTEDEAEDRAVDEAEIDVKLGDYTAFFSWIETAIIDGVVQEIKASPLDIGVEETKVYLNYPRGTEIIHDPKMGMADLLPRTGSLGNNMVFIAALGLLTIPGLALLFRKRNRK
ncbi:MAG: LPXTG cell wall anchor domain-containing protein [Candidatus Heimdallarchaeaceae archaeon]